MTWHDVTAVAHWCRYSMRRRSWDAGVSRRHCKWSADNMDRTSPKYRCAPEDSIHLAMTMEVSERYRAAGKNNDDTRVDYAIADANDWVLADYHTMVEVGVFDYYPALILARRGLTVRRQSWPAGWHLITRRRRGEVDDGAIICDGTTGQIVDVSSGDRDANDWEVVE